MTETTNSADDTVIAAAEADAPCSEPTTTQSLEEGTMTEKKSDDYDDIIAKLDAEEALTKSAGSATDSPTATTEIPCRTFADVHASVDADASLSEPTKRELRSAVRGIAKIVSLAAETQAVDLAEINRRLNETSPAMAGLTDQSYSNLRSRFRRALKIAGIRIHPGKQTNELTAEWAALKELLGDARRWQSISRLAHFASQRGWSPSEITDEHIDELVRILKEQAIYACPRAFHYGLVNTWNKCAARISGWPGKPLTVPSYRDPYMVDPSKLPEPLRAEIDRCFQMFENPPIRSIAELAREAQAASSRPSPFRPHALRRLATSTIKQRRFQFLQYLSALLRKGAIRLEEMISLKAVTTPALVEQGLLFFYERAGNRMAVQIREIALAIRSIVKHWLKDDVRLAVIDLMVRETLQKRRMSKKVEDLLRQFDDPANRARLLNLPKELFREARRLRGTRPLDAARLFEIALAIEILLFCPLRIGNLAVLDIDKHLLRSRPGADGMMHLVIPADAVKNGVPIEFELPRVLARLIEEHVMEFRVHLPGAATKWLFPRADGAHEAPHNLGNRLSHTIWRRAGIRMTPHMFRHFCAETFLERVPAGHGIVTGTLGHISSDTAPRFYIRRKMAKAGKVYAENILKLREEARAVSRSRRRRR